MEILFPTTIKLKILLTILMPLLLLTKILNLILSKIAEYNTMKETELIRIIIVGTKLQITE